MQLFIQQPGMGLMFSSGQAAALTFQPDFNVWCHHHLKRCFASTETRGLLGTGAQDGHPQLSRSSPSSGNVTSNVSSVCYASRPQLCSRLGVLSHTPKYSMCFFAVLLLYSWRVCVIYVSSHFMVVFLELAIISSGTLEL